MKVDKVDIIRATPLIMESYGNSLEENQMLGKCFSLCIQQKKNPKFIIHLLKQKQELNNQKKKRNVHRELKLSTRKLSKNPEKNITQSISFQSVKQLMKFNMRCKKNLTNH